MRNRMMKSDSGYNQFVGELKTPYKIGRALLSPTGNKEDFDWSKVDVPTIFRHNGKFYMYYLGFDGVGYRTGLAESPDLLKWQRKGVVLDWGKSGEFDSCGAAMMGLLRYNSFDKVHLPLEHEGRYWAFYTGFPKPGYEQGSGAIGLAASTDLFHWEKHPGPILSIMKNEEIEEKTLYRPWVLKWRKCFYLFWNSALRHRNGPWVEETNVAFSRNLVAWERYPGNPILRVGPAGSWDSQFVSDPYVVRYKSTWVMFYFGLPGGRGKRGSQEGVAFSDDLINWVKYPEPILRTGGPDEIDSVHCAKPSVIKWRGIIYHFYNAVDKHDFRTISVATSKPISQRQNGIHR